jgi:hypothetical protein
MPVNGEFDAAIASMEVRLRELDSERDAVARELEELRTRREQGTSGTASEANASWTPQRKLSLFAGLFRGREDVFPRRWEKPAKGRSGWAPCCDNEWKAGVCGKPRVKCGQCPNQAFRAPAQSELLAHLQGRQVMGTYPLLAYDVCWLLAIDLDGRSWRSDVKAIREVCEEFDVVPAIERSRSGDGAHVWFFFSEALPAALARRFGSMLLTSAMARTTTLGMTSYDRLFPSQDRLPKGGFGNLIALPLQQGARRHGNTLFVDERLEPFEDQWSYLQSLPRITPERVQELVAQETDEGVLDTSPRGRCAGDALPRVRRAVRAAWHRQDGDRRSADRGEGTLHARAGPSQAAAGAVDPAAERVSRPPRRRDRRNRRRPRQAERQGGCRDGTEPRSP